MNGNDILLHRQNLADVLVELGQPQYVVRLDILHKLTKPPMMGCPSAPRIVTWPEIIFITRLSQ